MEQNSYLQIFTSMPKKSEGIEKNAETLSFFSLDSNLKCSKYDPECICYLISICHCGLCRNSFSYGEESKQWLSDMTKAPCIQHEGSPCVHWSSVKHQTYFGMVSTTLCLTHQHSIITCNTNIKEN